MCVREKVVIRMIYDTMADFARETNAAIQRIVEFTPAQGSTISSSASLSAALVRKEVETRARFDSRPECGCGSKHEPAARTRCRRNARLSNVPPSILALWTP
jgi:hypothetical protein